MKTWKKRLALCALAVGTWLGTTQAEAAVGNPSTLNIDVAVNAALSVAVNGVQSSTYTGVTWNVATSTMLAATSTTTITNDTGGFIEKWALSTPANSTDLGGGSPGSWTLSTSSTVVGTNGYAVQAVFGSSNTAGSGCPGIGASDWNQSFAPTLATGVQTYTNTVFADTNLQASGGLHTPDNSPNPDDVASGGIRALCWRLVMPQGVSITNSQDIQIIVTAQNP